MREQESIKTNNITVMVWIALMGAVFCVTGPLSIPIGPVPISLQTMVLFISVYILGTRDAVISCTLYLLIGLAGLPVFTGYQGGLGKVAGPTGGYLVGYIPMILIGGLFIHLSKQIRERRIPRTEKAEEPTTAGRKKIHHGPVISVMIQFLGLLLATIVLYAFGTAWFVFSTGTPVGAALGMCVIPFIPGDLIKITAAIGLGPAIEKLVRMARPVD